MYILSLFADKPISSGIVTVAGIITVITITITLFVSASCVFYQIRYTYITWKGNFFVAYHFNNDDVPYCRRRRVSKTSVVLQSASLRQLTSEEHELMVATARNKCDDTNAKSAEVKAMPTEESRLECRTLSANI